MITMRDHATYPSTSLTSVHLVFKIKVSALEALKEPNLRLLSDLLSSDTADSDLAVDVNKAYAEEKVNQL